MEIGNVKVEIFGHTYTIKGDAPSDYIYQLSEFVDQKMNEVNDNISSKSSVQVAILAALNIADEYFQLKNLDKGMDKALENKTRALISMLDDGIIGDVFSDNPDNL